MGQIAGKTAGDIAGEIAGEMASKIASKLAGAQFKISTFETSTVSEYRYFETRGNKQLFVSKCQYFETIILLFQNIDNLQ